MFGAPPEWLGGRTQSKLWSKAIKEFKKLDKQATPKSKL